MASRKKRIRSSPLSHDNQLVRMALAVAKLEGKARQLRRDLKDVMRDLRFRRKELKSYAQSLTDKPIEARPDSPPMRIFGERQS